MTHEEQQVKMRERIAILNTLLSPLIHEYNLHQIAAKDLSAAITKLYTEKFSLERKLTPITHIKARTGEIHLSNKPEKIKMPKLSDEQAAELLNMLSA